MKTILSTIAIVLLLCSCAEITQDKKETSAPLEQKGFDAVTSKPVNQKTINRNKSEMDSMDSLLKTK